MDLGDQLKILQAAQGDPARLALATVDLAHSTLSEDERAGLKLALEAAAVPHWCDESLLAALLEIPHEESAARLARIRTLNVVETFPARGETAVDVHEATRLALLRALRKEQPSRFATLSARARDYLDGERSSHARIESLYHFFAIDQPAAAGECEALDREFSMLDASEPRQALASVMQELLDSQALQGAALAEALLCVAERRNSRGETAHLEAPAREAIRLAEESGNRSAFGRAHCLLGDVFAARGRLALARAAYETYLETFRDLTAQKPADTGWQRELAVAHIRLGDTFAMQGKLDSALDAHRNSLAIYERLATAEPASPAWQSELGATYSRVGGILSQKGLREEALPAFQRTRAIAKALASRDPSNAEWQNALALAIGRIGYFFFDEKDRLDDALAAFQEQLAIFAQLAPQDPSNAEWQRYLACALRDIGNVLARKGQVDDALAAHCNARDISLRLAELDPANAGRQLDLAGFHNMVGNTFLEQGRYDDALAAYREPLGILLRLAAKDSSNAVWQHALAIAKNNVGAALVRLGRPEEARAEFREAEAQMLRAIAMAPANAEWPQDLEGIRSWLVEVASSSQAGRDSGDR